MRCWPERSHCFQFVCVTQCCRKRGLSEEVQGRGERVPDHALVDVRTKPEANHSERAAYQVFYDEQCEICQACVTWLKVLDRRKLTICVPISAETLRLADSRLDLEDCLGQLHVVTPDARILVGWDAVACLARLFPATWIIGALGQWFPFRTAGRLGYGFVAANRYSLSKCRGGACRVAKPDEVRRQARLGPFWTCYVLGFSIRMPLVLWSGLAAAAERVSIFFRTRQKRLRLLDGRLTVFFLNGLLPDTVPLLFGELFAMVLYDGVAIDPGSPRMRRSLARHLRIEKPKVTKIVATHAHEEHVGNLNWLSSLTGARVYVSEMTARFLTPFKRLPWVRAAIIGQPPNLTPPFAILRDELQSDSRRLQVIATPGHCDDHIVLYDPKEKLLLAGDAFMGTYFATPNPDVDSRKWIESLEELATLDIEILVEGHGHIHTLRADIPDFPGVVIRENPKFAIAQKLDYLRWLRDQIEAGFHEQLPIRVIEATCFPWGKRTSWETCATDECIRLLSLGHFSRTELVRSFVRKGENVLPIVYEVRLSAGAKQ
jgi:glyoxylase-like metal-dependent hydrolase (beta-lactamase superfamily II)/predicted DCC family thiol-disulfide oxidoreductase YuxK